MLADIHERLAGVAIEQLPYADFVQRYDRPDMLFYLDPPYHGSEDDYGPGVFGAGGFAAIAELLALIRGRFILSVNDTPAMRATFARFEVQSVGATYQVGAKASAARELVIANFEIGGALGTALA